MNQYKSSFLFGVKLIILLFFLALPPFVGFTLGSWICSATQKFPVLYTPALRITAMQDFQPAADKTIAWKKVGLTSGKTIYFTTSRPIDLLNDYNKVTNEVVELVNNEYSVKRLHVKDSATGEESGIIYDFPDYYGTAIYGEHTKLGNSIIIPINIALLIICLASYFPIFKAIFNLFRHKKIFLKD